MLRLYRDIHSKEELMGDTKRDTNRRALRGWKSSMSFRSTVVLALAGSVLAAAPLAAQAGGMGSVTELGIDAGVTFGLGDRSSIDFNLPGALFRVGFLRPGSRF